MNLQDEMNKRGSDPMVKNSWGSDPTIYYNILKSQEEKNNILTQYEYYNKS
jgi:hypothetical protein